MRSEFPVLGRVAYLNAGTDGPLAARAVAASRAELERELGEGRTSAHFERKRELEGELRGAYARALRCDADDLALTTCTTEGIGQVVMGLELDPGRRDPDERRGAPGAARAARRGP